MTKHNEVAGFMKEQIAEAQKRFAAVQTGAEKTFKVLRMRGHELQAATAKKASAVGTDLWKTAGSLQNRLIQAAGVATQSQIKGLHRELKALSRKLDALVEKKNGGKPDARA
jgi:hypothetical protein